MLNVQKKEMKKREVLSLSNAECCETEERGCYTHLVRIWASTVHQRLMRVLLVHAYNSGMKSFKILLKKRHSEVPK